MIVQKKDLFLFEEYNDYIVSLNKFINKLTFKYLFTQDDSLLISEKMQNISLFICEEIFFYIKKHNINIEKLDRDNFRKIIEYLKRTIHIKLTKNIFNKETESKVVMIYKDKHKQKNERVYLVRSFSNIDNCLGVNDMKNVKYYNLRIEHTF